MKRDLLLFGIVVAVAGVAWMGITGSNYVNALVNYATTCSGLGYSAPACQAALAQNSLTSYWMLVGIAVFIIGLWATARSFMVGEDLLARKAPPPPRICPACNTAQPGTFCANDGTKLA